MTIERRGFLGKVSVGMAAAFAAPPFVRARLADDATALVPEPWLEGLTGRHKQFFDVAAHLQGASLNRAANFLSVYGQAYNLTDSDLNVVFGAHGTAVGMMMDDAIWSTYRLGSHVSINDPITKAPAVRNVFSGMGTAGTWIEPSVATLQKRGVRFIACMQAIARLSRELAARDSQDAAPINQALLAGLLPGVTAVPAMIVAANRAQESGLTYVYLG